MPFARRSAEEYPGSTRGAHLCSPTVSGRSDTTTYGKGVTLREYEEQHMLPRRSFFGKDEDER